MGTKRNPCGRHFCPSAARIVWAMTDWSTPVAAAAIGKTGKRLWMQANSLDLPERPWSRRAKRVAETKIRAAWVMENVPLPILAAELGMSDETLRNRAQKLDDFRPRKAGQKKRLQPCRWFAEMWRYDVSTYSMARHIGCAQSMVSMIAADLGLSLRSSKSRYLKKPTVADFMRDELPRILLARAALAEEAAQVLRFRSENDKLDSKKQGVIRRFRESRGIAA